MRNEFTASVRGLRSGRQVHSPVGVEEQQAVGVVHFGPVVLDRAACAFSPLKNMLVSGAMPILPTFLRRKTRLSTSTSVCVARMDREVVRARDARAVEQRVDLEFASRRAPVAPASTP